MYGVDGTTLRVPDTPENETAFGRVASPWDSTGGYPVRRLVALMVLRRHVLTGLAFGAFRDSELALAATAPDATLLVAFPYGCYWHPMSNLQVKNVPEAIHRRLRAYAKRRGRTVRDVVLEAVTREIDREEFRVRLAKRAPVDLGRPAAQTLEETRAERERELGG